MSAISKTARYRILDSLAIIRFVCPEGLGCKCVGYFCLDISEDCSDHRHPHI